MKACKYPGCHKQLIGKEKHLCQSCKDKIKDNAIKTGKVTLGVALMLLSVASGVNSISKKDD